LKSCPLRLFTSAVDFCLHLYLSAGVYHCIWCIVFHTSGDGCSEIQALKYVTFLTTFPAPASKPLLHNQHRRLHTGEFKHCLAKLLLKVLNAAFGSLFRAIVAPSFRYCYSDLSVPGFSKIARVRITVR
jgi:hypothetical protein